jgi:hypothetical protein
MALEPEPFVGAAFAATPFCCRNGFSRDPLRHREPEVGSYRSGFHCDPCVIADGGSGRKPLLQKPIFVGAALAATLASSKNQRLGVIGAAFIATLAPSRAESSGLKPLLQKPSFRRSGFSRDPCVIENQELGVAGTAFTATPAPSKAESSGRKPLLQKPIFVGAALAAILASSGTRGWELSERLSPRPLRHREPGSRGCRSNPHRDPCAIEGGKFGAKAPPTEAHFCRSGFSRDPLRHREPGSRGCRSNLHRNPCAIEDGKFGAKAPPTEAHFCRNGFSRDPLRHREPGSRGCRSNLHRNPCAIEDGKFGAKAPPTEAHFCRSGFSRDPCVIENRRLGVIGAAFIATLASSRTEVRGESPS